MPATRKKTRYVHPFQFLSFDIRTYHARFSAWNHIFIIYYLFLLDIHLIVFQIFIILHKQIEICDNFFFDLSFVFIFKRFFLQLIFFFIKHEKDMMEIVKIVLIIFDENQSAYNYFFHIHELNFSWLLIKLLTMKDWWKKKKRIVELNRQKKNLIKLECLLKF